MDHSDYMDHFYYNIPLSLSLFAVKWVAAIILTKQGLKPPTIRTLDTHNKMLVYILESLWVNIAYVARHLA